MVTEDDQWIEDFVINATIEELHTLLNFIEVNEYDKNLIKQLKLKIDEAP